MRAKAKFSDLIRNNQIVSIFDNIGLGIAWINTDYQVLFANTAMKSLCELDSSSTTCYSMFWNRSKVCENCPGQRVLKTEASSSSVVYIKQDSTKGIYLNVNVYPTFSSDGAISGFVEVVEDITKKKKADEKVLEITQQLEYRFEEQTNEYREAIRVLETQMASRRQAEAAFIESQKQLEDKHHVLQDVYRKVEHAKKEWDRTMDCVEDLLVLLDKDGRIKRTNRAFAEVVGKELRRLSGQEIRILLFDIDLDFTGDVIRGVEVFHKRSNRWLTFDTYHINLEEGEHETVIVAHDYTKRKTLMQKLEIANKEMSEKSAELETANAELKATQSKVLQQEKMATIGQLAAGVAHEINNPIGFVSSNLATLDKYTCKINSYFEFEEKLLAGVDDSVLEALKQKRNELKISYVLEDMGDLVAESLDGTNRVRKIVQDLKGFSRVDDSSCKPVRIEDCLESTINIIWNELKYNVTLHREYGKTPEVTCYPQQINQVFMNLLVNASHAIDKQGDVIIKTWREGDIVCIAISDTGRGIPDNELSKIFEPFFTTKEIGKGTGLGLSIAYDIVKKHGGEIVVSSEVGKGTEFTVCLPISNCHESTDEAGA